MSSQEACRVLGVDNTCSREELRAAYLSRIREVSSGCHITNAIPQSMRVLQSCFGCGAGEADMQHAVAMLCSKHTEQVVIWDAALSESWPVPAQVHPDVNPALQSTDDAVRLNEAYAVLQLVV